MQITSAMKMVSAAKLKRAQDAIVQMRPYAKKFNDILVNVAASLDNSDHPMMKSNNGKNILLIALSSNRGLCGGFNNNIVKEVNKTISNNPDKNYTVFTIGKKVNDVFKKSDLLTKIESLPLNPQTIWDDLNYNNSILISSKIIKAFKENKFDQAYIVYNSFKNAAVQNVENELFLPLIPSENESNSNADYIFEPDKEEILNNLIPQSLKIKLYKALLDSFASEHGARMTAMHKATDNANEMKNDLKLFYNKARQAAITNEILEIVAGAEALGG
jgi:F-type H+-transporting ATPase subunit gamma|tara:strand:+ start:3629 stop:4450 length:822 start_codon:yes stop_codon:yes gene_type:complete